MEITYFGHRRHGPEAGIEDIVAKQISQLFVNNSRPLWVAGSLSIGAGKPDLIILSFEPQVFTLTQVEMRNAHILAYLRTVGQASLETIADHVGQPRKQVYTCLNSLVDAQAVISGALIFSLSPVWQEILPEIITIEVKVTDWKKALRQASRNRIFAHRSFIALPSNVAERIRQDLAFNELGIGLLSVSDYGDVYVLHQASQNQPRVWAYYYQLAFYVAKHFQEQRNAFPSIVTEGSV